MLGAIAAVAVLAAAGCGSNDATAAPPPARYTAVPIGQTPWPDGTVGQYGLRIDPSLLAQLPKSVYALPVVEDAASESGAMNNADLARNVDGYAAASVGALGDADYLNIAVGRLKPDAQTADFYTSWVADYATGACSQADGVASLDQQQQIGDWTVDMSTCKGGPVVYVLKISEDALLSMWGSGSHDLGRSLIGQLQ